MSMHDCPEKMMLIVGLAYVVLTLLPRRREFEAGTSTIRIRRRAYGSDKAESKYLFLGAQAGLQNNVTARELSRAESSTIRYSVTSLSTSEYFFTEFTKLSGSQPGLN